jgi:putative ABC transport system substrate-binding protein
MERRAFLAGTAALLAAPLAAEAQQAGRVWRIGYLSNSGGQSEPDTAFFQGLRDLGYSEGRNISIKAHYAAGKVETFMEAAATSVASGLDLIAAWGPPATIAAKRATDSIPIVGIGIGSPVEMEWIGTVARPKGNVTGLLLFPADQYLDVKRLEFLREAVPAATRVGVLSTPGPSAEAEMNYLRGAAGSLKTQVELFTVNSRAALEPTFLRMRDRGIRALLVAPDAMLWSYRVDVVRMAGKLRLPAVYWSRDYVDVGGLLSYATSLSHLGSRAAIYVDKIIKGSKPPELPLEQPTKFELVVNLKTAKTLGLTIPRSLLLQADHVIE